MCRFLGYYRLVLQRSVYKVVLEELFQGCRYEDKDFVGIVGKYSGSQYILVLIISNRLVQVE